MAEMLTDLIQNIYGRISQLGKSIQSLQQSLDNLNKTLAEKVASLVDSIKSMTDSVEKEGEANKLILAQIGDNALEEIRLLQRKVGLKDLDELMEKLNIIVNSSQEALRPETVDVLLHEVLTAVKDLKEGSNGVTSEEAGELLDKIGSSLSKKT
jgi:hypothetical protein